MLILGLHPAMGCLLSQIGITGYAALDGMFHHATYEIQGTGRRRRAQPAVPAGCSPAVLIHSTICRKETRRGVNLLDGRALTNCLPRKNS